MSYPATAKQDPSPVEPVAPAIEPVAPAIVPAIKPVEPIAPASVNGASPSNVSGLTTLPDKRPSRRFFGLLPGRR